MDYGDILKRAWNVTWRYKILWLFGLFAGVGSYSYNSSSSSSSRSGSPQVGSDFAGAERFFYQYLAVFIVLAVIMLIIGIVWYVLSIAATGGLIHLVNEAEEGRPVRGRDGWRVGFSKWGRVWLQMFLISLPGLLLALFLVFAIFIAVAGVGLGAAAKNPAAIVSSLGGMCCFFALFVVAMIPVSVVLGIMGQIGLRYGVLEDVPAVQALKRGWADLRSRRGAFLMFLVMWGVGLAYGIVVAVVMLITIIPAVFLIVARQYALGVVLVLLGVLVLMVPNAIYAAFNSAAWTVFFRKMTGRGSAATAMPAPVVPGDAGAFPPPPPGPGVPAPPDPGADPWRAANDVPTAEAPPVADAPVPAEAPAPQPAQEPIPPAPAAE